MAEKVCVERLSKMVGSGLVLQQKPLSRMALGVVGVAVMRPKRTVAPAATKLLVDVTLGVVPVVGAFRMR